MHAFLDDETSMKVGGAHLYVHTHTHTHYMDNTTRRSMVLLITHTCGNFVSSAGLCCTMDGPSF